MAKRINCAGVAFVTTLYDAAGRVRETCRALSYAKMASNRYAAEA